MAGRIKVGIPEARTADNIVFDSIREKEAYLNIFRPLMRSGIKVEMQKAFPLHCHGPVGSPIEICKIVIDFVVTEPNGELRYYDPKGWRTDIWKIKKKWFENEYGARIVEL